MQRLILGSLAAGLAMWFVGFIFWGPLLGWIPFSALSDADAATIQTVLKDTLGRIGTGVYQVPSPATVIGTQQLAQGPVAMIHFTNRGFPAFDTVGLLWGLVLAIVCALLMGIALRSVAASLDFAARVRLVALVAVAIAGYTDIGQPVFNHAPWGYYIYLFISDFASWLAAGVVLARILPPPAAAPAY